MIDSPTLSEDEVLRRVEELVQQKLASDNGNAVSPNVGMGVIARALCIV